MNQNRPILIWAAVRSNIIVNTIGVVLLAILLYVMHGIKESNESLKLEVNRLTENIMSNSEKQSIYLKTLILKPDMDKEKARTIATAIYKKAKQFRRDPDLVLAMAKIESNLDPEAVSSVGAEGLIQVMPQWVGVFANKCNLKEIECNLDNGLRLLESYEQLYGNLEMALTVYNRGPTTVDWALLKGKDPDNGYAPKIMETYGKLKELR